MNRRGPKKGGPTKGGPKKGNTASPGSTTRSVRRAVDNLALSETGTSDSFEQVLSPSGARAGPSGTSDSFPSAGPRSSDSYSRAGQSGTSDSFERLSVSNSSFSSAGRLSALQDTETVTIYLKKVELTLNGAPIDMLEDRLTEG